MGRLWLSGFPRRPPRLAVLTRHLSQSLFPRVGRRPRQTKVEALRAGRRDLGGDRRRARLRPPTAPHASTESRVKKLSGETPASFMAFDLLADVKGKDLHKLPFADRRA